MSNILAPADVSTTTRRKPFTKMPDAILHDTTLSPWDRLAYLEVLSFAWESTGSDCTAAHKTMAKRLGCSVSTLKRALRKLEEAGLIERDGYGPGGTTRYRPTQLTGDLPSSPVTYPPSSPVTYKSDEVQTDDLSRSRRSGVDVEETATGNGTTTTTAPLPVDVEDEGEVVYWIDPERSAEVMVATWEERTGNRGTPQAIRDARELFAAGVFVSDFESVLAKALQGDEYTQRNWRTRFPSLRCFTSTRAAQQIDKRPLAQCFLCQKEFRFDSEEGGLCEQCKRVTECQGAEWEQEQAAWKRVQKAEAEPPAAAVPDDIPWA
jgi:hypothetical protein